MCESGLLLLLVLLVCRSVRLPFVSSWFVSACRLLNHCTLCWVRMGWVVCAKSVRVDALKATRNNQAKRCDVVAYTHGVMETGGGRRVKLNRDPRVSDSLPRSVPMYPGRCIVWNWIYSKRFGSERITCNTILPRPDFSYNGPIITRAMQ